MKFIMIVWLALNAPPTAVEFNSKDACEAGAKAFAAKIESSCQPAPPTDPLVFKSCYGGKVHWVCVEKGHEFKPQLTIVPNGITTAPNHEPKAVTRGRM